MTAMSMAAILNGMRAATERHKREERTRTLRVAATSARARLDALDAERTAHAQSLAERAARQRRLAPFQADMLRERIRLRIDLLAAVPDQHPEFEWSRA